jgi:hypothetical protein
MVAGNGEKLSPEEERHIQNLSVIPTALVFYVFLGYFFVFHSNHPESLSFSLLYFFVSFMVALTVFFLTWDILYAHWTQQPFSSRIKPFLGKMSMLVVAYAMFGAIYLIANFTLSSKLDYSGIVILTAIAWFVLWGLLVFYFQRRT